MVHKMLRIMVSTSLIWPKKPVKKIWAQFMTHISDVPFVINNNVGKNKSVLKLAI